MSQFPHLYILVLPPTLMWIGFSMNSPEVPGIAAIPCSISSSSSSLGSIFMGVGVRVVSIFRYLRSCGSCPTLPLNRFVQKRSTPWPPIGGLGQQCEQLKLEVQCISNLSDMNNMHYIVHSIHTSHNFAMLHFSIIKYPGHLHILLLFLHLLILHHLQSYLTPQLKPWLVFVWILLLKLQYMYFTFIHYISDTFNIEIELEMNALTTRKGSLVCWHLRESGMPSIQSPSSFSGS